MRLLGLLAALLLAACELQSSGTDSESGGSSGVPDGGGLGGAWSAGDAGADGADAQGFPCADSGITCATGCVDPMSDHDNCGTCGNQCSGGGTCVSGSCCIADGAGCPLPDPYSSTPCCAGSTCSEGHCSG